MTSLAGAMQAPNTKPCDITKEGADVRLGPGGALALWPPRKTYWTFIKGRTTLNAPWSARTRLRSNSSLKRAFPIAAKPRRAARYDYKWRCNGTANLFMMYASGLRLTGLTFLVMSRLSRSTTIHLTPGLIHPAFGERRKGARFRAISSPTPNGLSK